MATEKNKKFSPNEIKEIRKEIFDKVNSIKNKSLNSLLREYFSLKSKQLKNGIHEDELYGITQKVIEYNDMENILEKIDILRKYYIDNDDLIHIKEIYNKLWSFTNSKIPNIDFKT